MRIKPFQIAAVCLLAVTATAVTGCQKSAETTSNAAVTKEQPEVAVKIETVQEGELGDTSKVLGEVAANTNVSIPAKAAGTLTKLYVKKGDTVRNGQVIAELDQVNYQLGVKQAEAALQQANAALQQAKEANGAGGVSPYELATRGLEIAQNNYLKVKALVDSNAVPKAQLDQAESSLIQAQSQLNQAKQGAASIDVAQAAVNSAQVGVERARQSLDDTIVRATADGMITSLPFEVGATVGPQAPVATLININPVLVKVNVSENNLSKFKKGLELDIAVPSQSLSVKGKVSYVAPSADAQSKMFPIEIEVANPEQKLLPGMKVDVLVKDLESKKGLLLSTDAIIEENGKKYVFVVEGDKAVKREVIISEGNTSKVIVQQGASSGDKAVVKGQTQLKDQSKVRITQ